jgi:hypothetical protein
MLYRKVGIRIAARYKGTGFHSTDYTKHPVL